MKQAIIYSRFSPRPNADQCTSIEFQEAKCRAYCEAKGFDVLTCYRDANMSGRRADNRPGLQLALLHVTKIKGVLVSYDLGRVSRGIIDSVNITNSIAKSGADLAFVMDSIDTTTATGRVMFHIMAALKQYEREQTGERTSAKLLAMHDQGLRISNRPRYGFRLSPNNPNRVIPDHEERAIVRKVVQWRKDGNTYREIIALLNRDDCPCRGRVWHPGTVRRIVQRYSEKLIF